MVNIICQCLETHNLGSTLSKRIILGPTVYDAEGNVAVYAVSGIVSLDVPVQDKLSYSVKINNPIFNNTIKAGELYTICYKEGKEVCLGKASVPFDLFPNDIFDVVFYGTLTT